MTGEPQREPAPWLETVHRLMNDLAFAAPELWQLHVDRRMEEVWEEARAAERAETDRLRDENARLREFLALRPHGMTGALDDRIPWFIHCGISHGADRPGCVVCRALAAAPDPRPAEAER